MSKQRTRIGDETERCSFCGKRRLEVETLIAGPPGVFICNECIDLCHTILVENDREKEKQAFTQTGGPEKIPSPREIVARLDEYVIGQTRAKRILSVAVHNHYKRLKHAEAGEGADVEIDKSNILLIGPTGSGKTLLARTLARILQVPFAIGDATTLTEAGYVGEDVENILLKLLQAADFDRAHAERGIVFIDEIDKIGKTQANVSITRDVSGEGVQQALLKIIEGTVANIPPQGGRKHPEQNYLQLDTKNILFICGGAFVGLEEVIRKRVGGSRIGFEDGTDEAGAELTLTTLLPKVEPDDIIKFGMIPEFIGRLPVCATLDPLDVRTLISILRDPKNALTRQYQAFFEMEGARVKFEEDALKLIAEKAIEDNTGARALRTVTEEVMLDSLFDLPSLSKKQREKLYVVTPAVVNKTARLLPEPDLEALEQEQSEPESDLKVDEKDIKSPEGPKKRETA